ncbi:heat shock factor 2-binding protein-like isoform X1 [Rhinoderma darwinii]|uniref:heat shock factor 2-binding protein-like isoform X1 n=2 Tax=Rhinoderma darwinii TaxID=43563 RepID=UPI003F66E55B
MMWGAGGTAEVLPCDWLLSEMSGPLEAEFLLVRRRDLERLTTEVMQMKEFLPQILNQDLLEGVQRLEVAESALEERELDCEHIKARLQATQSECLRTKEENLALLLQVTELREQSVQQVDFCTQMGSALCTLLWGVSNREETVKSILGMDKTADFFILAGQTVSSFVETLVVNQDEDMEESRFVLGLAGTITSECRGLTNPEHKMVKC